MVVPSSTGPIPEGTAGFLTKTLTNAEAVVLPNVSPLTDRRKLKPSLGYEQVAAGLEGNGYQVGWRDGDIQVSPNTLSEYDAPPRSGGRSAYRPRSSGFLSFSNKSKADALQARPRTSGSVCSGGPLTSPRQGMNRPASTTSSVSRFSRAASSMDAGPNILRLPDTPDYARPHSRRGGALWQSLPNGIPAGAAHVAAAFKARDGMAIPMANLKDLDRPGTGMLASGTGRDTPQYGEGLGSTGGRTGGAPGAHPAMTFKATRGHALMVFNEMDRDQNGKITLSEFEEIALSLGLSMDQAHSMFQKLDRRGRGFLDALDWGNKDLFRQIQLVSTRYMQKFMGLPDISTTPEQVRKYWRTQELIQVKTLTAAINLVRVNAITRGARSASSTGNAIYDTFRFIDADGSGDLSKDELRDAFYALGVFLSEPVVEQIMKVFDADGSGSVQYHEFVRTMFPAASKSQAS